MTNKILTVICAIFLFAPAALAQGDYSESTPYKPREVDKADKKKKSEKKTDAALAVIVGGNQTLTIPVSVFDRSGRFISGLTQEDVSIFVDGAEVPVVKFEKSAEPVSVILILDSSPSAAVRFKTMQEQAWKFVQALPSEVKVMVVDFNSMLNVRSKLTGSRAETQEAIAKAKMGGGTSLYSAIRTMYEKVLPQVPGRNVIVLMTDGVDTTSQNSTFAKSLSTVETADVSIYPIYYDTFADRAKTRSIGQNNLPIDWVGLFSRLPVTGSAEAEYKRGLVYINDLAAASGGRIFSSEKLEAGTKSLVEELSSKYYATIVVPKTGAASRPVRVRVRRSNLAVFARGSFIDR